jgi:hypothetical protein
MTPVPTSLLHTVEVVCLGWRRCGDPVVVCVWPSRHRPGGSRAESRARRSFFPHGHPNRATILWAPTPTAPTPKLSCIQPRAGIHGSHSGCGCGAVLRARGSRLACARSSGSCGAARRLVSGLFSAPAASRSATAGRRRATHSAPPLSAAHRHCRGRGEYRRCRTPTLIARRRSPSIHRPYRRGGSPQVRGRRQTGAQHAAAGAVWSE